MIGVPGRLDRSGGFALVITVTLLALLVVIVVALASLTKVDGNLAGSIRHRSIARANALLALDVAVARLQQFAGPDARVTATAEFLDGVPNRHLTGVWDAAVAGSPLTWLVSGNEGANPLAIAPGVVSPAQVVLVGPQTVGAADPADIVTAPLAELTSADVPGQAGRVVVGRYAWWVGDEGVKASLALPDRSREVNYPPFDSPAMLQVLRDGLARGPEFFATDPAKGFDPLAAANAAMASRVITWPQVSQLVPVGSAPLTDFVKSHFHEFTAVHLGVLANTRADGYGGLKLDLSLDPGRLGSAFTAYANFPTYMEAPENGGGAIPPIADASSPRRRYRIQAPVNSASTDEIPFVFGVAPVLTEFLLQFSIQRAGPLVQTKARLYAGLWNPYTSALVPETLRLDITGLPMVTATDLTAAGSQTIDLQSVFGGANLPPSRVNLPFPSHGTNDTVSWLPGRLYTWTTETGATPSADLHFYDKNISATGWLATTTIPGTAHLRLEAAVPTHLTVTLERADGTPLATYTAPDFPAFVVPDSMAVSQGGWNFGFGFRLSQVSGQSNDRTWLVTPGADPRASSFPSTGLTAFDPAKGIDPAQYFGTTATASGLDHFLIFRSMGGSSNVSVSANNDVPVFELPRAPLLNPAGWQHLQLAGARPFALGNSWAPVAAGGVSANAAYERFFLSGLASGGAHPDLATDEPLPNFHLQVVETRTNPAAALTLGDLQAAAAYSGRHLFMRGAFNINSVSPAAWQAELSAIRFPDGWLRADIDNSASSTPTLGTQVAGDPGTVTENFLDSALGAPGFAVFRFPQSAAETFAAAPLANPNAPTRVPFRRGVRGGDGDAIVPGFATPQIATLAAEIAARVRRHLGAGGPFRTVEEFLGPAPEFGGRSLLEDAIQAAGLNPEAIQPAPSVASATDSGLSSVTLTQADLLGVLAPFLQARSDTFLVRAYGESVNAGTGQVAARSWCEATVQRLPATADPADDIVQPHGPLGRRFRIVSMRWLVSP